MTNNNIVNENGNVANNATSGNNVNDIIMKNVSTIITLAMLQEKEIKIGRLAGNRTLNEKIVNAKKKSLKETGLLVPAVIVSAAKAIEEGLEVVDFETGEQVTEETAKDYVVLVDANHRYKAHLKLQKEEENYNNEFYFMFPLQDISVTKMLSEINIATNPWKTADYGKGAAMVLKEKLPLLDAINSLTGEGYSPEAACKWLRGDNKITKTIMVRAMNGDIADELKKTNKIEQGLKLLDAAKKSFGKDFLKSRTLPDWIISKANDWEESRAEFVDAMSRFLSSLDRETADDITNSKGKRGGDAKETIINRKLNALWEKRDK